MKPSFRRWSGRVRRIAREQQFGRATVKCQRDKRASRLACPRCNCRRPDATGAASAWGDTAGLGLDADLFASDASVIEFSSRPPHRRRSKAGKSGTNKRPERVKAECSRG